MRECPETSNNIFFKSINNIKVTLMAYRDQCLFWIQPAKHNFNSCTRWT